MQTEKIESAIREFHDRVLAAEEVIDGLDHLVGLTPESKLNDVIWGLIGGYMEALNQHHHIGGWLEWWWGECRMDMNPMMAKPHNGEFRII